MQEHNDVTTHLLAEALLLEGLNPDSAAFALDHVTDASMEPEIPAGATIGVDLRSQDVCQETPYLVSYSGFRGIRYLKRRSDGLLTLKSASPEHRDLTLKFGEMLDLTVIGRVFYWEARAS